MKSKIYTKINNKEMKTCVIGLGYMGLPLLELISEKGFPAIGFDIDESKVKLAIGQGLKATDKPEHAFKEVDCAIICVPTPIRKNHQPDLKFVESATEMIAVHLQKDSIVILESTVAPGTTEEIVVPILEKSNLKASEDFFVANCPERIDPGNKKWTVRNIPRVVGGISRESADIAYLFYSSILDGDVLKLTSVKASEAVKIIENTFRDVNIAFVNELAKSFDKIGVDIVEVIRGASTKPFWFMPHYPGCGVGGHCIAVDPYYLIEKAENVGFSHKFLKSAREINNSMPEYTVQKVLIGLNSIGKSVKGSDIAVLGLSYKGGVGDTRESPAFPIIDQLKKLGANLTIFDPYCLDQSSVGSLDEALHRVDCIVVVTDHPEFKAISAELLLKNNIKIVVDGRNIFEKENITSKGIYYMGIGRSGD